jgi:D-glycero-D-manno-heptose 1,7-bisphosphate phosphatase
LSDSVQKIKVLFLDRDGTIIEDAIGSYNVRLDDIRMIAGSEEAIALAKEQGYHIVVVTNQAAVAKGIITEEQVANMNVRLQDILSAKHAGYDKIYCAFYHPSVPDKYAAFANWRKPATGMIEQAAKDFAAQGFEIDIENSYFIGDKQIDIAAGRTARLKTVLVLTGYGEDALCREQQTPPTHIAHDLAEAITKFVLNPVPVR